MSLKNDYKFSINIVLIFVAIICLSSCALKNKSLMNIEFKKEKPKYFGYSGVHLYAVQPTFDKNIKSVLVSEDAQSATLYKLYNDLAIFLSNEIDPNPKVSNVKTFISFGNPLNMESIQEANDPNKGYHLVGYLNKDDINELSEFIESNSLDNIVGVQKYYENLNADVKEELTILLEDRIVNELNSYLQIVIELINKCESDGSEIVLIFNS